MRLRLPLRLRCNPNPLAFASQVRSAAEPSLGSPSERAVQVEVIICPKYGLDLSHGFHPPGLAKRSEGRSTTISISEREVYWSLPANCIGASQLLK